ncbi:type II toxin-antitoxin system PemK/MazF family toxin [Halalkalibacter flavus]|uniref:type II toxin-antitoxin system PemK/MazF family toxin n=1 Tax=Halalkalibacter flavus TaxID=3090668 RepID=UPI002FCB6341
MVPGEIYTMFFPYKPPAKSGKVRPVIILAVEAKRAIAVAVKITTSQPSDYFPNREKIIYWKRANLVKPSYAELDSTAIIPITPKYRYVGELHPYDFQNILIKFKSLNKM